jgi:RNA polymerase sigma-70 factor (ECF subfamily)
VTVGLVHLVRSTISDEEVLDLVRRGDRDGALRLLMVQQGAAVWSHCKRVLRDHALAQDVHQQVFIEAHRDLETFRGDAKLKSWLLSIASHRCLDAIKARKRRTSLQDLAALGLPQNAAATPADQLDDARRLQQLERCLDELSAETRLAVLMRYRAGLSYGEMSASLSTKESALQMRVTRAIAALRDCLVAKGVEP